MYDRERVKMFTSEIHSFQVKSIETVTYISIEETDICFNLVLILYMISL